MGDRAAHGQVDLDGQAGTGSRQPAGGTPEAQRWSRPGRPAGDRSGSDTPEVRNGSPAGPSDPGGEVAVDGQWPAGDQPARGTSGSGLGSPPGSEVAPDGQYRPTARTKVRRKADRAAFDRPTVHAILDEGFICHVGFSVDDQPYMIPTGYARVGDTLYLHGSSGSRLGLRPGTDVCVTVTLLDGLVLARSALHHSMAYRSVVIFGRTRPVTDLGEKGAALRATVEHIAPGRSAHVRGSSRKDMAATAMLALDLEEVSAKVRPATPSEDEDEDYALPYWAGVLPLTTVAGPPEPDPLLAPETPVPAHVRDWRRPAPAKEHLDTGTGVA